MGTSDSLRRLTAVFVQAKTADAYDEENPHPTPLAVGALHATHADALALHRAIFSLCKGGWAFAAPVLLRTASALLCGTVVITTPDKQDEANFFGFKYFFGYMKKRWNEPSVSTNERDEIRKNVEKALEQFSEAAYREKAREFFFQGKRRTFWWNPEMSGGPTENSEQLLG